MSQTNFVISTDQAAVLEQHYCNGPENYMK